MKLLNGSELAGFIKERQAKDVRRLRASKISPKLAIVQVKDDPVINTYVRLKKQYGADIKVEVDLHLVKQSDSSSVIQSLNEDDSVHGIIVQLPLTDPSQTDEIVNMVAPQKDVDALGDPKAPWPPHLDGVQGDKGLTFEQPGEASLSKSQLTSPGEQRTEPYMQYGEGAVQSATPQSAKTSGSVYGSARQQSRGVRGSWFDPATPMAILWLLAGYNIELKNKKILLIGRGKLVGEPMEKILKNSGYDVEVIGREVKDLGQHTKNADIIITATGSPAVLYPDMIKHGAVVVDAGVASEEGKTVGDLAPEVYERDDLTITPQKGGVGPLTVCALFENVIRAAQKHLSRIKS